MNLRHKNALKTCAKVGVTLILLTVSIRLARPGTLIGQLRGANVALLLVSASILIAGGFAGAASWFYVLRSRLPSLRYREIAAYHWSGMFFNSFLPSNVGGDVVKGYIMARGRGETGFVVTSLLVDRLMNLGILLCIGLFTLLIHLGHPMCAALFLMLLGALLAGILSAARRLKARVCRWPQSGRMGRLARLAVPVLDLAATPRQLFPALSAALASQLLKTWHNVFLILALGLDLSVFSVWYVIPLFGMVSALPVSLGGLGLREIVAHRLAGPMAVQSAHLVMLSLAGHLMVVCVNMLGAAPFLAGPGAQRRRRDLRPVG